MARGLMHLPPELRNRIFGLAVFHQQSDGTTAPIPSPNDTNTLDCEAITLISGRRIRATQGFINGVLEPPPSKPDDDANPHKDDSNGSIFVPVPQDREHKALEKARAKHLKLLSKAANAKHTHICTLACLDSLASRASRVRPAKSRSRCSTGSTASNSSSATSASQAAKKPTRTRKVPWTGGAPSTTPTYAPSPTSA